MKITKEQLQKDLAVTSAKVTRLEALDTHRRQQFSEVLTDFYPRNDGWGGIKKAPLMEWEEVYFRIGELKADADYAMCIQAREDLKRENAELHRKLNPEKDKTCGCNSHA